MEISMTATTSSEGVQLHDFTEQFESGAFSDLRVKFNDRVWNLDKFVLATRCQFFAVALRNTCKESLTGEIVLEEQDPELVDQALRYIYSCNLSHLAGIEAGDPTGIRLNAYIPLYVLADYLCLHGLCRDLINRLHRVNRRLGPSRKRVLRRAEPEVRAAESALPSRSLESKA